MRPAAWAPVLLLPFAGLLPACAAVPEAGRPPVDLPAATVPVPEGRGSLRPDDLTIGLVEGPLRIEILPLEEGLLRLLVPDAAERLRGIRGLLGPLDGGSPFLVTFHTETQGLRFEQSDVTLEVAGGVLRARRVVGATQGWGTGLLRQREPAQAVYLFPAVDFDRELVAAYRTARSDAWSRILTRVQAERARVRGRSGGTEAGTPPAGDYSSSPNFRILR